MLDKMILGIGFAWHMRCSFPTQAELHKWLNPVNCLPSIIWVELLAQATNWNSVLKINGGFQGLCEIINKENDPWKQYVVNMEDHFKLYPNTSTPTHFYFRKIESISFYCSSVNRQGNLPQKKCLVFLVFYYKHVSLRDKTNTPFYL